MVIVYYFVLILLALVSQRSQTNLAGMSETTPLVGQIEADPVEAAQYRRYQYYTR